MMVGSARLSLGSADGCKADLKGDWSDDWRQPQRKEEGKAGLNAEGTPGLQ
jgi:hypothetical protein